MKAPILFVFSVLGLMTFLVFGQPPALPTGPTTSLDLAGVSNVIAARADSFAVTRRHRATLPAPSEEDVKALAICALAANKELGTNRYTWELYYAEAVLKSTFLHHQQLLEGCHRQAGEKDTELVLEDLKKKKLTPEQVRILKAIADGK